MRHSPQPSSPSPSFAQSRAGFVQPGEVRAEDDVGVAAWVVRTEAGQRLANGAGATGAVFAMAPAGAGFCPAA